MKLADTLDAKSLAQKNAEISAELDLSSLPRLVAAGLKGQPRVAVCLRFSYDQEWPAVDVSISTALELICQTCLEPFVYQLDSRSHCVLVQESQLDDLDDIDEPVIVNHLYQLAVYDLISDEVLLQIPSFPRHPQACKDSLVEQYASPVEAQEEVSSPFAALKKLKKS